MNQTANCCTRQRNIPTQTQPRVTKPAWSSQIPKPTPTSADSHINRNLLLGQPFPRFESFSPLSFPLPTSPVGNRHAGKLLGQGRNRSPFREVWSHPLDSAGA